jgi:hypothetical protein
MNVLFRVVALAALATATGCKPPLHLSYDYGRAYVETLKLQADRTRPSVVNERSTPSWKLPRRKKAIPKSRSSRIVRSTIDGVYPRSA